MNGPLMSRNSHTFRLQPIKCKKLVHFANKIFSLAVIHSRQLMVGIKDQSVDTFCFKKFQNFFQLFCCVPVTSTLDNFNCNTPLCLLQKLPCFWWKSFFAAFMLRRHLILNQEWNIKFLQNVSCHKSISVEVFCARWWLLNYLETVFSRKLL